MLCCPLPTDRKMRKNRVGFYLLFFVLFVKMSDLGEEFAKICIQWPKKALVYAFWLHSAWVFPILENSTLSRYVQNKNNKKQKNRPTDPIFKFWSGEGNITNYFFLALGHALSIELTIIIMLICTPNWKSWCCHWSTRTTDHSSYLRINVHVHYSSDQTSYWGYSATCISK